MERILASGHPGIIRAGIGTPVAGKCQDFLFRSFDQQGIHLIENLPVGKMVRDNGVKGAFGRAGAATGAGGRIDDGGSLLFHIHGNGVVGADFGAFAAGLAFFGNDFRSDGVGQNFPFVHQADGPCRRGRGLGDTFLDVFGPFGASGVKNAAGSGIHGLKLGMGFQKKTI